MAIEKITLSINKQTKIFPYLLLVVLVKDFLALFKYYILFRQYKRYNENRPIPKELASLGINQKKYKDSIEYSKAKLEYNFYNSIFMLIIDLLSLYYGLYPYIFEQSVKLCVFIPLINFNPNNEYGPLFIYTILDLIKGEILSLPFDLYFTFCLEEKFGFNKTTLKTFIKDKIKTILLWIIFLPLIYSAIVFIIIKCGKYFFIICEIFTIFLVLFFLWAYPNLIQPLFNKFSVLEDGELKEGIFKLAEKVNYPLKKIYVMDQSERSSHSNAYLYGFGRNKRIVLFDTLIKKTTPKEIESVLGHELGHWKYGHSIINMVIALTHFLLMFYLLKYFINEEGIFISFGFEKKCVFIGLMLFMIIYEPFSFIFEILQNFIVRKCEYQADKFSCSLGYGENLKSELIKLSEENKADFDPDPLYSWVHHSHPTLLERIKAINEEMNKNK